MTSFNGLSEAEASFLSYIDGIHSTDDLKKLFGTDVTQFRMCKLSSCGYIGHNPNTNNPILLSPGLVALSEYKSYKSEAAKHRRTDRFRFWFPLILSNSFALAALIISIIALMK